MQVTIREMLYEYPADKKPRIMCAADAAAEAKFISEASKEFMVCFYLNTKHDILAREIVSVGLINASLIHPREVFRSAIHINAQSVVMVHNHPSGEAEFSSADIEVTNVIAQAGEVLGIELLDHIVVAGAGYKSAKEERLIRAVVKA
jgi:DNA repair protein RadC